MRTTTVVIIGAGQAGLAMSQCLTARSIDHAILDKGSVAQSWKSERWDSLRLLTPNWLTRLPGHRYEGNDPNGYMTAAEVVDFLDGYKRAIDAPVHSGTTVETVETTVDGFEVRTDHGTWRSKAVVIATGAASTPRVPELAADLPASVQQLTPNHYRNPDLVGEGRVLVVGASASGAQIADELARSGREVTLAVGEHIRLPRSYRGMDIHWWMNAMGHLDERFDEVEDLSRARRLSSLQLVGSPDRRGLGLNELQANGVELVGRLVGVAGTNGQFAGSLANQCAAADLKQGRLLDRIDEFAAETGLEAELSAVDRPDPTVIPQAPNTMDLRRLETVVWATGYRPRYPWLDPALLDRKGGLRHDGGVVEQPGMYVLGLPFTRRRKSNFIDGVGPDAEDLSAHLAGYLERLVVGAGSRAAA